MRADMYTVVECSHPPPLHSTPPPPSNKAEHYMYKINTDETSDMLAALVNFRSP
jgi:hypothetical protein